MQLMRLPAVFTTWSNIVAAHLVASGGAFHWHYLVWTLLASTGIYLAGMILNDCFDLGEDRCERPNRPLPSGAVSMPLAWTLGFGLILAGLGAAYVAGDQALMWAFPLAGLVLLYDGRLKHGVLSEISMAGCRYLNWIMGMSVVPLGGLDWLIPLPIFLYTLSLTILSGAEVSGGNRTRIHLCMAGMVLAGLSIAALPLLGVLNQPLALLAAGVGLGLLIHKLLQVSRTPTPAFIQAAMKMLIIGIIPLDALLLATAGQVIAALALLLLLLPSKWLARQIYIT